MEILVGLGLATLAALVVKVRAIRRRRERVLGALEALAKTLGVEIVSSKVSLLGDRCVVVCQLPGRLQSVVVDFPIVDPEE